MTSIPSQVTPITDLELHELIVAAYPEKFGGRDEEDLWQEVEDFFYGELCNDSGSEMVIELLSRLVYLTQPMTSMSGKAYHVLGEVERCGDQYQMIAAVKRGVKIA